MKIPNIFDRQRVLFAFLGFALFSVVGYYAPRAYLQYYDDTHYIDVPQLVTFDRKVYSAGETQRAKLTLKINVDSDIVLKSRLMLILLDNQFEVVKQSEVESFVVAKDEPQTFLLDAPLPCDLVDGNYLYRGEVVYVVRGVEKRTVFDTDVFTVMNNRASDSAQIAKNCPVKN